MRVTLIERQERANKIRYVFSCDACGNEIERAKKTRKHSVDVCSLRCLGNLRQFLDHVSFVSLYAVTKRKETMQHRHGHSGTFGSSLNDRVTATIQEKHGVTSAAQDPRVMSKVRNTNLARYGHVNNVHGSCNVYRSPFVKEDVQCKAQETITLRYGTKCAANSAASKQFDHSERYRKAYETKKKRGLLRESVPEVTVRTALEKAWGCDQVIAHPMFNSWSFDMYVVSLNTYVQVDGVYWHGIDRDLVDLKSSHREIDRVIFAKRCRDEAQNAWFACHGDVKLVRITDVEVASGDVVELLRNKGLILM